MHKEEIRGVCFGSLFIFHFHIFSTSHFLISCYNDIGISHTESVMIERGERMELMMIAKNRLKLVLTSEDMEKYSITPEMQGDAGKIMDWLCPLLAQKLPEFDAKSRPLRVQMFAGKGGGCEMYIQSEQKKDSSLPVLYGGKEQKNVYYFENMESLLSACKAMQGESGIRGSMAYAENEKKGWYLVFTSAQRDVFGRNPTVFSVVNEYGKMIKKRHITAYLKEHCIEVCQEDAITILGNLG